MNHKKLYRLYREEKLMVRRRGGPRLSAPTILTGLGYPDFVNAGISDGALERASLSRPSLSSGNSII
jgi:hypothetical protein